MTKLTVFIPDDMAAEVTTSAKGTAAYKEFISAMNRFSGELGISIKSVEYPTFTLSSERSDKSIVDFVQNVLSTYYFDAVEKDTTTDELSRITIVYKWE